MTNVQTHEADAFQRVKKFATDRLSAKDDHRQATKTKAQTITLTALIILGFATSATAGSILLDFEELPAVSYSIGTAIPETSRLSTQYLTNYGIVFSSQLAPYMGVVALGMGHATSGVNGISGATADGTVTYAGTILIAEFFDPTNPAVPAVTDEFSVRGDQIPDGSGGTLNAYDVNGQFITNQFISNVAGNTFMISTPGIHKVTFDGSGTIALDDVSFDPVTAVPVEPSLTIQSVPPNSVLLLWPTNPAGFNLQFSTNLTATNWESASPLPVIVGTNNVVTNTTSDGSKFYRLSSP